MLVGAHEAQIRHGRYRVQHPRRPPADGRAPSVGLVRQSLALDRDHRRPGSGLAVENGGSDLQLHGILNEICFKIGTQRRDLNLWDIRLFQCQRKSAGTLQLLLFLAAGGAGLCVRLRIWDGRVGAAFVGRVVFVRRVAMGQRAGSPALVHFGGGVLHFAVREVHCDFSVRELRMDASSAITGTSVLSAVIIAVK